ncbi:LysR family transcriptional regulator [Prauserella rugosa]|uniref:DNA-binding transcriptional LysR family regulator n=1 Tax=Prauserella rugosa TaxID=43354 RepID=A0A660CNJ0_9PSEU|nr:LysR family transcriptional regulator [Prauserella rugosa]KMS92232.1 LysR family transcriptional regulator [Streptomyces regensis]TWH22695.1 DNA-binding transcriptional LysR family regulator [Prauserella rugosa]
MEVELRHVRALLAVARRASFSRAAEELGITQPALSRTVAQLERIVGVRLIDRSTRQVGLTEAGADLLPYAENVMRELAQGLAVARKGGTLRLGFSWLLPDPWAQDAMRRFEDETGASVTLVRCDDPLEELQHHAVDVALVRGQVRRAPAGSQTVYLYDETRVALCSERNPLAQRDELDWADVPSWPLVVNTRSGTTGPWSFPSGEGPRHVVETANFDEWLESVAADRGIGIVPEVAQRRTSHRAVRFLPLTGAPPSAVHIVHLAAAGDRLMDRFVQAAVAAAQSTR